MNEELAVKNLKEVKEIFDRAGVKYWLDSGTLLGAMRDGKIIEWGHDIDLGAMEDS
jgi:phosphorylcholine metabolism protein LicD